MSGTINERLEVKQELSFYLNAHYMCAVEDLKKYACKICDYSTHLKVLFDNHYRNLEHKLSSEPLAGYACPECASFYSHSFLVFAKHKYAKCKIQVADRKKDMVVWYKCRNRFGRCAFKSVKRLNVKKHSKIEHFSENIVCTCQYCDHKTKTSNGMKDHIRNTHFEGKDFKWFECVHCPFQTRLKLNVEQHTRTQHKKDFKCDFCDYETHSHYRWKKHQLRHRSEWIQREQCSHKIDHSSLVGEHVNVAHTVTKMIQWLQCDICPYKSQSKWNLTRHLKTKHSELENVVLVKCEFCDYTTKHKSEHKLSLEYHVATQHVECV